MYATLISATLVSATLTGAVSYLAHWRNTVHALAREDRALAELGEAVSERINRSLAFNRELAALHLTCQTTVLAPPALAALQAEAQRVVVLQSAESLRIQALLLPWRTRAQLQWNEAMRDPLGPCTLPGRLRWPESPLPRLRVENISAGIRIDIAGNATWRYQDARVETL